MHDTLQNSLTEKYSNIYQLYLIIVPYLIHVGSLEETIFVPHVAEKNLFTTHVRPFHLHAGRQGEYW